MIYFNDHLNIKSQGQPELETPLVGSVDNLANFPASSNLQDLDVSKWVNILMNQSDEYSLNTCAIWRVSQIEIHWIFSLASLDKEKCKKVYALATFTFICRFTAPAGKTEKRKIVGFKYIEHTLEFSVEQVKEHAPVVQMRERLNKGGVKKFLMNLRNSAYIP